MFYEIKFNAQCSRAIDFFDVNGGKQFQEKFKMFCINADKIYIGNLFKTYFSAFVLISIL